MSDAPDSASPEAIAGADELLEKADALIRKHHADSADGPVDDLPVLTDIVEVEDDEALLPEPGPDPRVIEQLVELDATLALAIENWVAEELPQIIARECEAMNQRIREQAVAHLRATLAPELSREIASLLDLANSPRD